MWGKIIIPTYRLWLNGLYGLYGPRCHLSSKRPINLISLPSWTLIVNDRWIPHTNVGSVIMTYDAFINCCISSVIFHSVQPFIIIVTLFLHSCKWASLHSTQFIPPRYVEASGHKVHVLWRRLWLLCSHSYLLWSCFQEESHQSCQFCEWIVFVFKLLLKHVKIITWMGEFF